MGHASEKRVSVGSPECQGKCAQVLASIQKQKPYEERDGEVAVCLSNGQATLRKVKLLHGEVIDWRRCVWEKGNYIVTLRGQLFPPLLSTSSSESNFLPLMIGRPRWTDS